MFMQWGDPRRLCWATNQAEAVTDDFSFLSLFNTSNGPHIICVHDVIADSSIGQVSQYLLLQQGPQGSDPVAAVSAFSGEAAPVGEILVGSVDTVPTPTAYFNAGNLAPSNVHQMPLFFLLPGWSLTAYNLFPDAALNLSFWYEWRWAWEFPNIPNDPNGLI